jgi:hypothetical protein
VVQALIDHVLAELAPPALKPLTLTSDARAYPFEGETVLGDVLLVSVGQRMWRARRRAAFTGLCEARA